MHTMLNEAMRRMREILFTFLTRLQVTPCVKVYLFRELECRASQSLVHLVMMHGLQAAQFLF